MKRTVFVDNNVEIFATQALPGVCDAEGLMTGRQVPLRDQHAAVGGRQALAAIRSTVASGAEIGGWAEAIGNIAYIQRTKLGFSEERISTSADAFRSLRRATGGKLVAEASIYAANDAFPIEGVPASPLAWVRATLMNDEHGRLLLAEQDGDQVESIRGEDLRWLAALAFAWTKGEDGDTITFVSQDSKAVAGAIVLGRYLDGISGVLLRHAANSYAAV